MDKLDLIEHFQLGDMSSFSELYKLYAKRALGTAYLIAGQKSLAEDIVQESFIQCFHSIKGLKNIETFDVWFYKIITRTGWRMVSKNKSNLLLDEPESIDTIIDYNSFEKFNSCDANITIYESLAKLNLSLRTVIVLYYFNDMTIKNISKVLGCFEGTVKSRLHNAKKQLRHIIGEDVEEPVVKTNYAEKECVDHGK
ncbi:RNA polymerase sigma factor [Clostridium lacusfryxellense]|uniref:RNA polymerase sigma factor n=1 Tax=Clostridium lacusfryxellense TaxID=205328 RepID=UPI001C0DCA84|nr:RNA polymerase sigma factor [Clostridium lacusfryxellense]MBU3110095.1 RNA polymerase sigma factor [Clostridium lacusfryxellense]